jgi:hypothetical protein
MAQDITEPKIIQDDTPIWGADRIAREIGLDRQATWDCCLRSASVGGGSQAALGCGRR